MEETVISTDPPRTCGPCTACCTVMAVHELAKARYEACEHLCANGCGIYADRPTSCRTFECQWLRGLLEVDGSVDPELRPDACGVMFDFQPATPFGDVYTAWEVEPGASVEGHAADIIEGLAERFLVIVMTPGPDGDRSHVEHRFVGPPRLVAEASAAESTTPIPRTS